MRKIIFPALLAVLIITLAACAAQSGMPGPTPGSDKISIVTTVFPLYDFARAVAGDQAEVIMLLKPGAEVHSFEPTPADIIKMQNASLFLYVGGESEAWVEQVLDSLAGNGPQTLRLMDCMRAVEEELVEGMEDGQENGDEAAYDEHIWTAPGNAILMVNAIAEALAQADAAHAKAYRANAAVYTAQISALDKEITDIVAGAQRRLLIFGDRFPFRYFADAYGLEYRAAFPGCSTDAEPSAATLAYLIDMVSDNDIPYIYYIELSNENVARAICEQTGAERLLLHSCQQLSREDIQAGATYLSLMQQNAENLRKGLN